MNIPSEIKKHRALYVADLKRRGITTNCTDAAQMFPVPNARQICSSYPVLAATVIPYFNPDGSPMVYTGDDGEKRHFHRIRLLEDPPKGFVQKKPLRYKQAPGSPVFAYFPKGIADIDWPTIIADPEQYLLITEGEFKSIKATLEGFPCIGLGGVDSFMRSGALLPELEAIVWKGRLVFIVYDAELNPSVRHAERKLTRELIRRGATVHVVQLPMDGEKRKALDDYLIQYGPEALANVLNAVPEVDPGAALIVEGSDVELADAVLAAIADQHDSAVVSYEGSFYVYRGTRWTALTGPALVNAVCRFDGAKCGQKGRIKLNDSRIKSVLSIMHSRAAVPDFFADAPAGINCASGFITFGEAGEPSVEPHAREHRQRHCLPGRWEPGATWSNAPLLTRFLEGCFGEDKDFADRATLVAEVCGVAALGMGTRLKEPKAIVAYGPTAANGKSELLAMLSGLLPPEAACSVPPTRFADERMLAKLVGRKLNACAELGTSTAIAGEVFKGVVTGDQIAARDLYQSAVFFRPEAQHVYATNTLPPFQGGFDRGVQRRLLVLTFNRSIPKEEAVANIGSRIAIEEADELLAFAVEGASRIIGTGRFTEPESCRLALHEWIFSADPVLAWYANRAAYEAGHRTATQAAYEDFKNWAEATGFKKDRLPAANNFVNRLRAQDARIRSSRTNKGVYYIVGLKLLAPAGGRM